MVSKYLGNISDKDYKKVWQGWAKNSKLGNLALKSKISSLELNGL